MNQLSEGLNIKLQVRSYETEEVKEIEVRSYFTIGKFKVEIQKRFDVPVSEQVLAYSNMKLEDDCTIQKLIEKNKLSEGDMIHLFWVHPTFVNG